MLRIPKAWKNRLSVLNLEPVLPYRFKEARKRLRWNPEQAADFLWVSERTVRNWESGNARIPYSAFRLMRLRSGHAVAANGWDGWTIAPNGALVSPAGRPFLSHELEQLERIFAQSRLWREGIARVSRHVETAHDASPVSNTGGK